MNHLREKLLSGETAIGTHISLSDSTVTEIMGRAGFDYLWIDTEHTSFGLEELRNHLVAAEAAGTAAIVRIPELPLSPKRQSGLGAEKSHAFRHGHDRTGIYRSGR